MYSFCAPTCTFGKQTTRIVPLHYICVPKVQEFKLKSGDYDVFTKIKCIFAAEYN